MIKLTVLYNLPPGTDPKEFENWRIGPHQENHHLKMPGILKTDFYRVYGSVDQKAPYRYITELYFPDMETFNKAFYDPDHQERLKKSLERTVDSLFLISEELITKEVAK